MADYIKIYGELRRPLEGQHVTDSDQIKYDENETVKQVLARLDGVTYVDVPELKDDYIVQASASHKETVYTIEVGATTHAIVGDSTIKWMNGEAPVTQADHIYVVSVIGSLAVWGEFPKA